MTSLHIPPGIRAVVFDVGETLVDESRAWRRQAELAGVTPLTLMAVLGSLIERGVDHREVWSELGVEPPSERPTISDEDLYPDALACLQSLQEAGFVVGIAGNQPAGLDGQLRTAGFEADFIASSTAWGVSKPSPEFFARTIAAAAVTPTEILYVGDRLDNDIVPARLAGMRTALIVRGPWGHLHARRDEAALADLRITMLSELVQGLRQSTG
ncbi:HAD family hydrolase [Brachybacterium tyrofermentans]|uniref:HAD family hydrolase n=1 Tax=Brachybacterium tyrofermentans TaxID=47848 RepID=UPI003F8EF79B